MNIKLYTFFRSSASYRVRIALNLKGLRYESIPIHFRKDGGQHRKPDFLSINPQGLLPVLCDENFVITQSMAILEYLDEITSEPPLLPSTFSDRAQVRAISQLIASDIHPINNLRILNYLRNELGQDDGSISEWVQHWIGIEFAALEKHLESTSGDYCFGNNITLADICLVPQVYNARRYECDLNAYPNIVKIDNRLVKNKAFIDAAPERQVDAE